MFGVILGTAAIFAFGQALGVTWAGFVWTGILFFAGALLSLFIPFHHGKMRLGVKATWVDPQQRQHMVTGVQVTIAGFAEILRAGAVVTESFWGTALPAALFIVGLMFLSHAQHGTEDAARKGSDTIEFSVLLLS